MVNLTRIYTRTGDDGTTSLGDLSRTGKNDPRLQAYADVTRRTARSGYALALGGGHPRRSQRSSARSRTTSSTSAPTSARRSSRTLRYPPLRVTSAYVDALEAACDEHNERWRSCGRSSCPAARLGRASCTSPAPSSGGRSAPPGRR